VDPNLMILDAFKWLGAVALLAGLLARFAKTLATEFVEFRDWWRKRFGGSSDGSDGSGDGGDGEG
jgi:hypothetical protein